MSKLESIIYETYGSADELIALVRKVDLETNLNTMLDKIESALESDDHNKIVAISGPMLSGINNKLSNHSNQDEKQKLEYLLADIFEKYLIIISQKKDGPNILAQVDENLRETCEIAGYDYDALTSLFNIRKHVVLLPQRKIQSRYYYEWNGIPYELDEIIRDIADKKWIYSVKEMRRVFSPVTGNLQIRCNPERKAELLIFFHKLKEFNLITPKGRGNSGHFRPICTYAVDNEGNFIYQKAVNKLHNRLKNNLKRYAELTGKAEKIIESNAPKSIGQ
ncbi:MAG: hypothetical protein KDC84_01205 [Crocinitomicaceae bacterium]|nr:hypothetical protein [Crocinitomicaceae bacterium]